MSDCKHEWEYRYSSPQGATFCKRCDIVLNTDVANDYEKRIAELEELFNEAKRIIQLPKEHFKNMEAIASTYGLDTAIKMGIYALKESKGNDPNTR